MTKISLEQVGHVANLARLEISSDEAERFAQQLGAIITFAEQLNELEADGIEPTSHVLPMTNVMREDKASAGLAREEALKNAPAQQDGYFKVPPILGE